MPLPESRWPVQGRTIACSRSDVKIDAVRPNLLSLIFLTASASDATRSTPTMGPKDSSIMISMEPLQLARRVGE
ncbi:hypothetical protein PsorP6_004242 [Peronosclerospora sorghi]|uniref:Uncharacterized protein n=1 Tax=Peronosclerospora sorghi TaxID=230839 RepID=A0ACC0VI83_9STRA|nr:hypothetical protein PsorP6_004242 [Peronosclerospora sorghi]